MVKKFKAFIVKVDLKNAVYMSLSACVHGCFVIEGGNLWTSYLNTILFYFKKKKHFKDQLGLKLTI